MSRSSYCLTIMSKGVPPVLEFDFVASSQLGVDSVHRCLRPADTPWGSANIDLRALRWIDPGALVGLAAFMESQQELGRSPHVLGPVDPSRSRFLSRMGLPALVHDLGGSHDLEPVRWNDQREYLLELQRFDGRNAASALAVVVQNQISDPLVSKAIHKGICEIGANVLDHSDRSHGYIAVITKHASREVSFGVADAGVGMVQPLRSRGFRSHEDVVQAVLEGGLSRLDGPGRGRGIRRTREVVTGAGGRVFIGSGDVGVQAWAGPGGRSVRRARHHDLAIVGTLVQASIESA